MIDLPYHLYVRIDAGAVADSEQRGAMFALQPNIGGVFGAHVLLECGAVYRNIPIHQLRLDLPEMIDVPSTHGPNDAQVWDCYASEYRAIEYTYLRGLATRIKSHCGLVAGRYLFTLIPQGDGFSVTSIRPRSLSSLTALSPAGSTSAPLTKSFSWTRRSRPRGDGPLT